MTTEPLNLLPHEEPFWKDVFVEAIRGFWNRDDDDLGQDPVAYGNMIAHAAITELRRNRANPLTAADVRNPDADAESLAAVQRAIDDGSLKANPDHLTPENMLTAMPRNE